MKSTFFRKRLRRVSVSFRHGIGFILLLPLLGTPLAAQTPAPPALALQISNETAPAGGWVQVKISLAAPALVASGRIVMNFDPTVFGPIGTVSVFSAAGDTFGLANTGLPATGGQLLDVPFSAPSGGIGQFPDLPILTVTIPVLPSAAPGTVATISADPTQSAWQDPNGNTYAVTVAPGSVTVGANLWIQSVAPAGGIVPAGRIVRIKGGGFTAQTAVDIDGAAVASAAFAGPGEIDLTLAGATEITGKRVAVQDAAAATQSTWVDGISGPGPFNNAQPIFPLEAQLMGVEAVVGETPAGALGLQNPTAAPVDVVLTVSTFALRTSTSSATVPPYSSVLYGVGAMDSVAASASAALRMIRITDVPAGMPPAIPPIVSSTTAGNPPVSPSIAQEAGGKASSAPTLTVTPASLVIVVSSGSASAMQTLTVQSNGSAVNWYPEFQISPNAGLELSSGLVADAASFSVDAGPSMPGVYYGSIQLRGC